jgi:hypothetical protein
MSKTKRTYIYMDKLGHLDLVLIRKDEGFSYEWQDDNGRVVCCGWSQGTRKDGEDAAMSHIKEASESDHE